MGNASSESVLHKVLDADISTGVSGEEADALWNKFDTDGDGVLDKEEAKKLVEELVNEKIKHLQQQLDQGKAEVDSDLEGHLKQIEKAHVALSDPDTLDLVFNAFDANHDGQVSKAEFLEKVKEGYELELPEGPPAKKARLAAPPVLALHQYSSAVIPAPAGGVFETIKPLNFKWQSSVASAAKDEETEHINVAYADHTVQTIHQIEYSGIDMKVTWEVIASDPPSHCASQVHTMQCHRITETNQCFLSWNTDFSSDATIAVIEDAKYKKLESFEQLKGMFGPAAAPA